MEAHTTCAICNHSYNSSAKRPLVLPCSHSFCKDCLQQLEAAGDQLCPVCRKTWHHVKIPDLPFCYQLIPGEGQTVKKGIKEASEAASLNSTCGEHEEEYIFWCESCDGPACKKCWRSEHKGCELVLIDEKEDMLQKQHEADVISLKEKNTIYSNYSAGNEEELAYVRSLVEDLQSLEQKLLKYQTDVKAWQAEAQKKLSEPVKRPRALLKLSNQQKPEELDDLERKIRSRPSSLLLHVAATYQSAHEDSDAFVSALQSRVEARRADGHSCDEHQAARARDPAIDEAVAALTDGGNWVITDDVSLAAVKRVLQDNSIRPAKLQISTNNLPDEFLFELQTVLLQGKNCSVEETLSCFPHSTAPCAETRASTTARLTAWTTLAGWCSLTQFCGHLDVAAVQKLPATIKSVGLVLRDQQDMAVVNALCTAAFKYSIKNDRSRLNWPGWTDLNLAVAKTFEPDHWKLEWKWPEEDYNLIKLSLSPLTRHGVHLRLHLPQLLPEDRRWMMNLFRVMALDGGGIKTPVPLLLPGTRIDPDPLLGVLRDGSGQLWEVHLPASLPQLVPREEVAERYKKDGHTVTWDLQ